MNFRGFLAISLAATLPFAFFGCATTSPDRAFGDVNQLVSARLGQTVSWSRSPETARQDAAATEALLRQPLTERSAVAIALLNNRALQADFEELGVSQAEFAQASRLPNPAISGNWRVPDRAPSAVDTEYSLVGNLLDLLTLPARKNIAGRNLQEASLHVAARVVGLACDTEAAFYRLQAQLETVSRLEVIARVSDAAEDFAKRQHEAGNINDLDLAEQQASSAQAHLDLMRAQAGATGLREELNRLMGLSDGQLAWTIDDRLPALPAADPAQADIEAAAVKRRLDLAAARERAETLAAALRLQSRTRLIPGVSIGVDTERGTDGQRVTGPTLGLELPLFDQGQPAQARLAAEYRQARDRFQALEAEVRSQVRQSRAELAAAREAVELSDKRLLPVRTEILRQTLLQYNAMQKSTYDLLLAKRNEQEAVEEHVDLVRDYWLARVALERAEGGRSASDNSHQAALTQAGT